MDRTKKVITDAFWQLLTEKPYNKITVKNIVELCGVNRNTFYYHFPDIPYLLEHTIEEKTAEIIEGVPNPKTPLECIIYITKALKEHGKAMSHIYNSMQKDLFLKGLEKIAVFTINRYTENSDSFSEIDKETQLIVKKYYKCLVVGILLDWLDNNMDYDLLKYTEKLYGVMKRNVTIKNTEK